MIFGFHKFTEGMEKSDQAYQTKRMKNLQFYREWRQLFPEAPISDHQNVIDTLSGGSSYLKQQLPSTAALRSYADKREKDREYNEYKIANEKMTSHINALNSISKMIDNKITANSTFESLEKDVVSMFPDPSSPGAQTAQALMRNYRPTFDAKLVSLKGDMATKIAEMMQGIDAGDAAEAATSLGLQANADVLQLAVAKRKRRDRTERDTKVKNFANNMQKNETVQQLINMGDEQSIKKAMDFVSQQATLNGLKLQPDEISLLNAALRNEQTARTPIIATKAVNDLKTNNPEFLANLRTYIVKQGRNLSEPGLRAEIEKGLPVMMNPQAKEAALNQIYNKMMSPVNINSAEANLVKDLAQVIGSTKDYSPQAVSQRTGIPMNNIGLINKIINEAKGQQAEKDREQIAKINEQFTSDQNFMNRLSSPDANIRENAIMEIQQRYNLFKVGGSFDALAWRIRGMDEAKVREPALIQQTVSNIEKSDLFKKIIALGNDGKDAFAVDRLEQAIPRDIQGSARQKIFNELVNRLQINLDAGTVTLQKGLKIQIRKSADEQYTTLVSDLAKASTKQIQGWAATKFQVDEDDTDALKASAGVEGFLTGKDIANGTDLTRIYELAWQKAGLDKTRFLRDQPLLLEEAYNQLKGAKKLVSSREGFIAGKIAQRTATIDTQKEFSAKMKSLQTDFADLRPALEIISSAPFYDEKLKRMVGTNDPTKFITQKNNFISDLLDRVKKMKSSIVVGTVIFGDVEAGTFDTLNAMEDELNRLYKEQNPVALRLRLSQENNMLLNDNLMPTESRIQMRTNPLGAAPQLPGMSVNRQQ